MLGNEPGAFGAGEVAMLFRYLARGDRCSCSEPLRSCPVWSSVWRRVETDIPGITYERAHEVTRSLDHLLWHRPAEAAPYAQIWQTTFAALASVTRSGLVVDSSKTMRQSARRPASLRSAGIDVRTIHLVRDPRAVVWSTMKWWWPYRPGRWSRTVGPDSKIGRALRGGAGWVVSNLVVRRPDLVMRYEDLVDHPEAALKAIGDVAGTSFDVVAERLRERAAFDRGHGVGGNYTRQREEIRLRPDRAWEDALPWSGRMIAGLTAPIARRYGYGNGSRTIAGRAQAARSSDE